MTPLLIVLAVGFVVVLIGHFGRQFWGRARTMDRHRHALDTLAGITRHPDAEGLGTDLEYQAHVRVVGPGGQPGASGPPVLPPPRAMTTLGPGRSSPFRRPSRMARSATAMEPVAMARPLARDATTRLVRSAPPPSQLPPSAHRPVGQHAGSAGTDRTPAVPAALSGRGPEPPANASDVAEADLLGPGKPGAADRALAGSYATGPVPLSEPQVYYFDDLAPRPEEPLRSKRRSRRGRANRQLEGLGQVDSEQPPDDDRTRPIDVAAIGAAGRAASRSKDGHRQAALARWLAVGAAAAAAVAIGVTLVARQPSPSPKSGPSLAAGLPSLTTRPSRSVTTSLSRSVVTTTVPITLPPPKPAVLLSTSQGTVTYQLHSATASIVIEATGRCWVEVRVGSPAGSIVTEETLVAGQSARVTGPAWVRLGNPPAVSVLVDGTTIAVPGATQAVPLNLRFTVG